jgi:hypothetical protein
MDELQMLSTVLAEPAPSAEALARSRQRLRTTMRGGPIRTRRRTGWLAGGIAVAAAGATAIAVASDPAGPTAGPNGQPSAIALSGQQVLLAAATVAESKSTGSGTYWHLNNEFTDDKGHHAGGTWETRDGQMWVATGSGAIEKLSGRQPFGVGGVDITYAQLQKLPTSPAALKTELVNRSNVETSAEIKEFRGLADLLIRVPAPPKVRAAAFRALAGLPHIKNLGKVSGGQRLQFTYGDAGTNLIVDPETSTAATEGFTAFSGKKQSMGTLSTTGEWTNTPPQ